MNKIESLNLEIIDICNLKCSMCDIWKNKNANRLSLEDIKNITNSNYIDKNTDITLTWGEPFLNPGINEIIYLIHSLWFQVSTISTNWILYTKIEKTLDIFLENHFNLPNIHISIDWLEKSHDKQRGRLSFKKSMKTILRLKNRFKNLNIKIKYTITWNNIWDIEKVYLLSKKLSVKISFKIVENDIFYTNRITSTNLLSVKQKDLVRKKLSCMYKNKDKYINNLIYYIKNNKLNYTCKTPKKSLFIMANWEVFPCTKYPSIWNMKNSSLDRLIWNEKHKNIINIVEKIKCSKCFSLHWAFNNISWN